MRLRLSNRESDARRLQMISEAYTHGICAMRECVVFVWGSPLRQVIVTPVLTRFYLIAFTNWSQTLLLPFEDLTSGELPSERHQITWRARTAQDRAYEAHRAFIFALARLQACACTRGAMLQLSREYRSVQRSGCDGRGRVRLRPCCFFFQQKVQKPRTSGRDRVQLGPLAVSPMGLGS
jgi:hypothetical protein